MEKVWEIVTKLAQKAYKKDEVPIGCVIVKDYKILSMAYNKKKHTNKCTSHAEILAIEKAEKKLKDWRLDGCTLYVSLKPCDMCMEVIRQARIKDVFYLIETKFDNEKKKIINYTQIENEYANKCTFLLQNFFKNKR